MPLFKYEVADATGKTLIGAMDASSEADVRARLIAKGYRVNAVIPTVAPKPVTAQAMPRPQIQTSGVSAPPNELSVFFRGLASYLQAGVGLHQALLQIAGQTPNKGMRIICERMSGRVQVGQRLSDAMSEFPRAFPPHVIGLVAAGELGGFLPIMIGDVALNYELTQKASNRWFKYVCHMAWVNAIGVVLLAPLLPSLFAIGTTDMQSMLANYLHAVWRIALPMGIVISLYHVARAILRQPSMRPLAHSLVLRAPSYGRASKERSLAGFSRILWRLQNAGILPITAWDTACRASENVIVAQRLHGQLDAIRSGRKFSDALSATGLFTSEDQRVLSMGESSGQTADVLGRIAASHEDEAMTSINRTRWFNIRILVWVNVLALAALGLAWVQYFKNMFTWVDWFFGEGSGIFQI